MRSVDACLLHRTLMTPPDVKIEVSAPAMAAA